MLRGRREVVPNHPMEQASSGLLRKPKDASHIERYPSTMNPQTLCALMLLNDLRHAATDALRGKHKMPALVLFYSFIDICASLTAESFISPNRERFESYLRRFATLTTWRLFTPYDLWAARCSVLHAYSPLGNHAQKSNAAKPIFYFAWPEDRNIVEEALKKRGYSNFYLMDVTTLKTIAIDGFNEIWRRVESEDTFELRFRENSKHILRDLNYMQLESELQLIAGLTHMRSGQPDA